jgi:predicted enzyme related to lactoylglutathione lyase
VHGQFIWYELTSPDPSAAKAFYPTFTGWGTQPFGDDYTMWTTGRQPHAGLFTMTPEMRAQGIPPNWLGYVEVADVDETAALATSLGATILHGPANIPQVGRFAVLHDPQGVVIGIYKSATGTTGWDGTPVAGRFSWHELMVPNHTKAFEFYRQLFGWDKLDEMDMGGGLMYLVFGKGKAMYGGMFSMTGEFAKMHPFWLYYIHVKDVPKAVAAAQKAGAALHRGPMDIPGGVIAILGDPQGAAFALHHANKPAAKQAPARKAAGKKAPAKKAPGKKASVKKAPAKRASRKKSGAKKSVGARLSKRKAAKRKTAKRRSTKRPAAKKQSKRRASKRAGRRR